MAARGANFVRAAMCLAAVSALSACTQTTASLDSKASKTRTAQVNMGSAKQVYTYSSSDRECLKRAMYFESRRSSPDGFMAVGSVIMNRLTSGLYPETICGVVGQEKQFAPGVMTRKMDENTAPQLNEAAEAVLKGKRHPDVKEAMFFHTKGLRFPYKNMHYVADAGGNVFYEKRDEDGNLQTPEPKPAGAYVMMAEGTIVPTPGAMSMIARAEPVREQTPSPVAVASAATQQPLPGVASVTTVADTSSAAVATVQPVSHSPSMMQAYQAGAGMDAASAAILSTEALPNSGPLPKRRPAGAKTDTAGDMVMVAPTPRQFPARTATP